jgi:hypothetical protein
MQKAEYQVSVKNDVEAEAIFTEIDRFFIELEQKHANVQVKA